MPHPTSLVRVLVAWLVMAALPLQGLAAASMLFCGQAAHSTASERAAAHNQGSHGHAHVSLAAGSEAAAHDHASHSHHPDPQHAGAADAADPLSTATQDQGAGIDDHACPICAACCNLVALYAPFAPSFAVDLRTAQPPEGATPMTTRVTPTPDRPPRA